MSVHARPAAKAHGRIRIGISGWTYKPWRGDFYPPKLPQKRELAFAASQFPTIEINGTFYSLQRPSSFAYWCEQTPDDFVFSIKGSRYITHMLKLRDVEQPLANFLASGVLKLGRKLGPMLWQFPPNFAFTDVTRARLESFFELLPHTAAAAGELARNHDSRMDGRAFTGLEQEAAPEPWQPMRHAIEIRHSTFVCEEFIALLRRYQVALVCADTVDWPRLMDVTAEFLYLRLHGSEVLYTSGYSGAALDVWAARVAAWAQGEQAPDGDRAGSAPAATKMPRDVYVYFDNDAKVFAPKDALALSERVRRLLARSTL